MGRPTLLPQVLQVPLAVLLPRSELQLQLLLRPAVLLFRLRPSLLQLLPLTVAVTFPPPLQYLSYTPRAQMVWVNRQFIPQI